MRWARRVLWLSMPAYAGVGALFLVAPAGAASLVGFEVANPTADNDVRAVYGGLGLGLATFLCVAARRDAWVPAGLAVVVATMGGLAAARLVSWWLVGPPSGLAIALHAGEILGFGAGVFGWRSLAASPTKAAFSGARVRPFRARDYPAVRALWERTEGIGLNETDTAERTRQFLAQNEGLSCLALDPSGCVVGAVLCGHDGRRGYLHHLAVDTGWAGKGVAKALLAHCVAGLERRGIDKCNVFVFEDNSAAVAFWNANGWAARSDLRIHQRPLVVPE